MAWHSVLYTLVLCGLILGLIHVAIVVGASEILCLDVGMAMAMWCARVVCVSVGVLGAGFPSLRYTISCMYIYISTARFLNSTIDSELVDVRWPWI